MARASLLSPKTAAELRRIIRKLDTMSGPGVLNRRDQIVLKRIAGITPATTDAPRPTVAVKITALANDYLTVKTIDGTGSEAGSTFDIAKPFSLRHLAANYPWATTFTSTDTNTATVGDGTDSYTWTVTPRLYTVGDVLLAVRVPNTGVTVASKDLKWEDANIDGRAWGAE